MKNKLAKLISISLVGAFMLLTVGCASGGKNETKTKNKLTKGADKVKLSGTFIQSWLCNPWDDERWGKELKNLKDLGMDIIVLGDTAVKSTAGAWTTYYPSKLEGLKEGYLGSDTVENALRNCKKYGFKVFVGMSLDENWWDKFVYDKEWLTSAMNTCNDIANELYANYHEMYKDTFYGWYWNPEIWNADIFKATSAVRDKFIDVLSDGMNISLDYLSKLSPDMPFMFSPFANTDLGSADDNYQFWRDLIKKTNFRKGDILCPMDSVGAGGTKVQYLDKWLEAYSKAVAETGKIKFWANCEDFDYTVQGDVCTADMGRFSKQMEIAAKYCEKTITFAYSHYYSPYNTVPGYDAAYRYYIKNGKLESEAPTAPANFTVELQNNAAILEWNESSDNIGICGYNIYREGKLIENIRAGLSDNVPTAPVIDTTTSDWEAKSILETVGQITYDVTAVECSGNESEKSTFVLK